MTFLTKNSAKPFRMAFMISIPTRLGFRWVSVLTQPNSPSKRSDVGGSEWERNDIRTRSGF